MIEVHNLTKHYGPITAIRDVSFTVAPGEIVGFLGPNGAGKSTTMRILSCFMPASGGTAKVAGYDVFAESLEVRRRIGYLPENVPLYTDLRVGPYLEFVAEIKGVPRSDRKRRVVEAMERCRILDVQNRLIGKLSKGYRQRVGLAQAIVSDPAVLILDEPTIGLDPKQITEIRDLIKSLAGDHTVILSTHILPEVSMVCSSVVIINKGVIVAQGPIDTLVEQFFPTARVEVEIAAPSPAAVREALRVIPGVVSVSDVPGFDGIGRYVVESSRGRDVRGEVFRLAAQQRWDLRELRRMGMTLEEVFLHVVAGEQSEHAEREDVVCDGGTGAKLHRKVDRDRSDEQQAGGEQDEQSAYQEGGGELLSTVELADRELGGAAIPPSKPQPVDRGHPAENADVVAELSRREKPDQRRYRQQQAGGDVEPLHERAPTDG